MIPLIFTEGSFFSDFFSHNSNSDFGFKRIFSPKMFGMTAEFIRINRKADASG